MQTIPTNTKEYNGFTGPVIRVLRSTGYCGLLGKVYGETDKQYKVVIDAGDAIVRRRYAKSPKVHFEPCKYCPPNSK